MYLRRIINIIASVGAALVFCTAVYGANEKIDVLKAGGWYESIFAQWNAESEANYEVYYKLSSAEEYTKADSSLIRIDSGTARVDVLGLLGDESYDLKITNGTKEKTVSGIKTASYSRDGYAHWNYNKGVGAYNDDGTPKDDAVIIYVSEDTKNTVTAVFDNKTYTGIIDILAYAQYSSKPVIIRVLDKVTCPQYYGAKSSSGSGFKLIDAEENDGTTAFKTTVEGNLFKYTQSEGNGYFPYNMVSVKSGADITVEGVGENAVIYQWGISFSGCTNVEVRNLTFTNAPEDCVGFEENSKYVWVHNNVFNEGKNLMDLSDDKDKAEGDGSTDIKNTDNAAFSYNVYNNCHKTSLCGGNTSDVQNNVTYHHNYFNKTMSRNPRARNSNIHSYNNYFYGNTEYGICASYQSFVFSEANYFESSNNPLYMNAMGSDKYSGTIKSWNDVFINCENSAGSSYFYYYTAVSRDDQTAISNLVSGGKSYSQFDTDSSEFYYDSAGKATDAYVETAENAKETVLIYSGIINDNAVNFVDLDANSDDEEDCFVVDASGTLISCSTEKDEIAVPEEADGTAVKAIGSGAFGESGSIKFIMIPDSIVEIADDAFNRTDFVIFCNINSEAEEYAKEKGIEYTLIGDSNDDKMYTASDAAIILEYVRNKDDISKFEGNGYKSVYYLNSSFKVTASSAAKVFRKANS